MEIVAEQAAPCPPDDLFAWVEDLDRYPAWIDLVSRTDRQDDGAWAVDLRARVGPLARTKRLRMVRTVHDAPSTDAAGRAVFERIELDGRDHGQWRLTAEVSPTSDGSCLVMSLAYDGRLWGPVVERLLRDEIERARPRLLSLVAGAEAG